MIFENEFRYCFRCGGEFERQKENLLVCGKCDLHYYVNPKPTNAVILVNKIGQVLLTKRKHDPMQGYWDLPGGFVNIGETIEESIDRELKEELDITITNCTYLTSEHDIYPFRGIVYHTICSVFVAHFDETQVIKPADDVSEAVFFDCKKIDHSRIAFEGVSRALKKWELQWVSRLATQ